MSYILLVCKQEYIPQAIDDCKIKHNEIALQLDKIPPKLQDIFLKCASKIVFYQNGGWDSTMNEILLILTKIKKNYELRFLSLN